jgi:multidrug efflux pump subunit AcrB
LPAVTVLSSLRVTIASAVAGGPAVIVLPICVLPVFRVLAANYEAWFSPLAIIL